MARPRESWLRSPDHEKWAAAMCVCRHPAGLCGADEYCHYGDCFKRPVKLPPTVGEQLAAMEIRIQALEAEVKLLKKGQA